MLIWVHFSSVTQSCPTLCDPWTAGCQTSLFTTNSRSMLKLMSVELVMPSNHLILCHPLLLLPSIFPSIRVFPNESVLHIMWPKYWSFSKDSKAGTNFKCLRNRNNLWGWCIMSTGKGRVWKVQRRKTWVLQKDTECTRVHFFFFCFRAACGILVP